jgi:N-acetylglucosaminyldiphosphoundecaprenol N-acetyl-beta-D-mannosaminyltransferase
MAAPGLKPSAPMTALELLGTPLLLTDYRGLGEQCRQWARSNAVIALEFANTQVVSMRRHEPWFRELTSAYNGFAPDGMPLVWCLRLAGAGLRDRVYGPIFMRQFLSGMTADFTHYLLGGSAACGDQLRAVFGRLNPALRFVGAYHGNCQTDGRMEGAADEAVIEEINRVSPDFLWVGFGTPKQQAWVKRYKRRLRRGVILTVGFAFDVNAGLKPDAPLWLQRLGLTWVYRLASEPRRLTSRYLRYNSLFLSYLLWDGLRGRAWSRNSGVSGQ